MSLLAKAHLSCIVLDKISIHLQHSKILEEYVKNE